MNPMPVLSVMPFGMRTGSANPVIAAATAAAPGI